jgi:hypothetical protein
LGKYLRIACLKKITSIVLCAQQSEDPHQIFPIDVDDGGFLKKNIETSTTSPNYNIGYKTFRNMKGWTENQMKQYLEQKHMCPK